MIHILILTSSQEQCLVGKALRGFHDIDLTFRHYDAEDLEQYLFSCDVAILCTTQEGRAMELVRKLRAKSHKPLIAIIDEGISVVASLLDAGVDDCISIRCGSEELHARCRSLVRRSADPLFFTTSVMHGDVSVDLCTKDVTIHKKRFPLTKTEYRLLYQLLLHAQKIVPKSKLETCLKNHRGKSAMHRVDMHIMNLRRKTGDDINIETISCHGLKLRL